MASNVSNLLKEKIVTPVANSIATQVDNKVKNGIILRKFIGVQLGESNTGCQLVKIDLNKINVKDPSYEFTLYIKAFSQKGLFNFIVNVNKTDSLQVDVKCEVKNSDSINGEVIGYYDVDAVGNTITISLLKAFVVNTSINECKFVSTKDTLNISDLDIDWSDTGNIKTTSSINIKYEKTYSLNIKQHLSQDDVGENEAYRIAKFDLSKFAETDFGGNYSPDIYVQLLSWKFGYQYLFIRPLWANSSKRILLVVGTSHIETNSNIMINDNIKDVFNFSKIDDNTIGIYYSPSTLSIAKEDAVKIISYTVHGVKTYEPEDNIVVDWTCVKESIASLHLSGFSNYELDFNRIFTPNDDSWIGANGIVPHPTTSEADNKYLLGADAKWHPRKTENEYIADLKPTEEIKGLSETDTTKGISFVTFDFNALSQKVIEAAPAPSTVQNFMIDMKVLTQDLGIITISTSLAVNPAGLIMCTGVLSDRGMGSRSVSFSTTYSGILGAVTTPGFFVNDRDTKIFKIALYTPIAIDGVKIIDAVVTSYSDIIDESDITFTWELGILEKKPYQMFISNIIYPRIDLDRELVFDQMNIETPISETDEDTLFAEQIKHNGLVPAPGKYEVNNGYFLKADGNWDKPGMVGTEDDIKRAYILRPDGSWGERGYDVSVSDIILDPSFMMDGNYLRVMSIDISDLWEDTGSMKTDLINVDFRYEIRTTNGLSEGELTAGLKFKSTGELEYHNINLYFENIYPYDMYATLGCGGINVDRTNKKIDLYINPWNITSGDQESYRIKSAYCSIGGNTKPSIDLTPTLIESSTLTEFIDAVLNDRILGFKTFETWDITGTYEDSPSSEIPDDLNTLYNLQRFRYNGLVPSPSPKDVENGCFLKADGSWDLPKRQVQDVIATVTPTSEMISQVEAAKTTKLISFLTIDVNEVASTIEKAERFVFSLDVLTNNFGLVRIGFNLTITATGNSNISSFSSNLGTNLLPVQLTHITNLKDYGVETMSVVFAISDTNNKGIFNIGFNGNTMKEKVIVLNMSCIPKQSTVEYKAFNYIFEPTLIDLDSSNTIRRLNSTMIGGYMDPSKVFTPMSTITSEDIVSETDPYELSIEKMRNNGFVPAPYQYELDNGYYLKADGTWSSANDIMTSITTNPEDEGKILKAHNGSVIWATLINGEEVGY